MSTCLWFLQRWARSYLMPKEIDYSEIRCIGCYQSIARALIHNILFSMTLLENYGAESARANGMLDFLLKFITLSIPAWRAEANVVKGAMDFMVSIADTEV